MRATIVSARTRETAFGDGIRAARLRGDSLTAFGNFRMVTVGTRGSFWALVTATLALEGVAVAAAGLLGWQLLGCQWYRVPLPANPICTGYWWPFEAMPWVMLTLVGVTVVVAAAVGGRTVMRNLRGARSVVGRLLATSVPTSDRLEEAVTATGLSGRVDEVACPAPLAETYGLAGPRVLVSTGLLARLDDKQLQAVLAHEAEHVRRRDPLRVAITRFAADATFPFPVLRPLAEHAVLDAELRADRCASDRVGIGPLASALAAVLDAPYSATIDHLAICGIHGLAERIRYLRDGREPILRVDAWRVGVSAASLVGLAAVALLLVRAVLASYAA